MSRWLFVLPTLALIGGLPVLQKDRGDAQSDKQEAKQQDGKDKGKPLVDIDAFLREYDRDKDGSLTKEEMPDWLHYNFARLDANKDGKISKEELQKGMAYLSQRRRPSDVVFVLVEMSDCDECCAEELHRVYEFVTKLDKNKDGKIDADELKAGRMMLIKERVAGIIKRLDANKDGKISKEEARGLVKDNFKELDTNKDGFVDSNELQAGAAAKHADAKEKDGKDSPREK